MRLLSLLSCCLAIALCGCAGYRLGPTSGAAPGAKSIQVNPFENKTLEPGLTDAVTAQLRKELMRDGTYRLASQGDGDIVVSGAVTLYHRRELAFSPRDTLTVTDYRLSLTAQVIARERSSGKVIFEGPVSGYTLVRVGDDLSSTERQALPLLAQDLARNLTTILAEGAW
jgi:hypothetical protein